MFDQKQIYIFCHITEEYKSTLEILLNIKTLVEIMYRVINIYMHINTFHIYCQHLIFIQS